MNHYKTIVLIKIVSAIVISYQGCGNFEVLQEGSVSQNSSSETKSPTDNSLPEDPVLDPLPTIDTQVKKSITPYFKNDPIINVTDNIVSISSTPYDDDSVEVRVVYGAVPSGGPAPSGSALSHQKPSVVSGEKLPYTATGEPAKFVLSGAYLDLNILQALMESEAFSNLTHFQLTSVWEDDEITPYLLANIDKFSHLQDFRMSPLELEWEFFEKVQKLSNFKRDTWEL